MISRLTNEEIDRRLEGRNIERIGDCNGATAKIAWKCLICGYFWNATPNHVATKKRKRGCRKCSGRYPLTNEEIDRRLLDRNIERISDYFDAKSKMTWKCLMCQDNWTALARTIINQEKGCPGCAHNRPLTNEDVDRRLMDRGIERIDDYENMISKMSWKCLLCSNIWLATSQHVLNNESGCPKCNTIGMNERLLVSILDASNIKYEHDLSIKKLNTNEKKRFEVDFYLPEYNYVVEYNGIQHYEPTRFGGITIKKAKENFIKQQNRDSYVRRFCEENNINLLEIDGRAYKNERLKIFFMEWLKDSRGTNDS